MVTFQSGSVCSHNMVPVGSVLQMLACQEHFRNFYHSLFMLHETMFSAILCLYASTCHTISFIYFCTGRGDKNKYNSIIVCEAAQFTVCTESGAA